MSRRDTSPRSGDPLRLSRRTRDILLLLLAAAVFALWWWASSSGGDDGTNRSGSETSSSRSVTQGSSGGSTPDSGLATVAESRLPDEAREVLALIRVGGPYRYDRDGVTFRNRERILPAQQRGYYKEYTVPTPGESDRGARRIVGGADGDRYYTDDHYDSFRQIEEGR
ncbi:ribonuclease domain-containing protein [Janibacter sp. G56]|uniref:ribonuclease domain-containing protein n=1 Tax=Janibacter sp. G56 TaxID=3418717 RepID=UPI003D033E1A